MSTVETRLDPVADTFGQLITPRQLYDIRRLAESLGVDVIFECRCFLLCNPEELSRDAAMIFHEHLSEMREAGIR